MTYKGYTIERVTKRDWIISLNGERVLNGRWCQMLDTPYAKNASTLREAKERIDKLA